MAMLSLIAPVSPIEPKSKRISISWFVDRA